MAKAKKSFLVAENSLVFSLDIRTSDINLNALRIHKALHLSQQERL